MTTQAILTYRTLADTGSQGRKSAAIRDLCEEIERLQKRKVKRDAFTPPAIEQVSAYMAKIGLNGDSPQAFMDHYQANGWRVGKSRMVDVEAAIRNWKRNRDKFGGIPVNGKDESYF